MTGVHALVLAAGSGARFGGRKLLAPWRNGVLLDGALRTALASPVDSVSVVTGADAEEIEAAVAGRARTVRAERHAEGMAASLRAGLGALPAEAAGVLVFLGDMPLVPETAARRLVGALSSGALAAAPFFRGRRGHPVAFAAPLFPRILALRGDIGARSVLDALGQGLARIDVDDPGVTFDVDRPEDLPA